MTLLGSKDFDLRVAIPLISTDLERYRSWLRDIIAHLVVPELDISLPIEEAWVQIRLQHDHSKKKKDSPRSPERIRTREPTQYGPL